MGIVIDPDELIVAARDGDRRAFDELVRQTYQDTYTLARRLTGNEEDARDVVQETYLRAWKGMKRFRGDAAFSTWLYRITANTSYTVMKRGRRHRHAPIGDDVVELPEENLTHDPEAAAEASDLRRQVADAVEQLPPKLRVVLVLRDVYGLSHDEISEELGISVSSAKVRLHRARKRLHDVIYGDPGGPREKEVDHAV